MICHSLLSVKNKTRAIFYRPMYTPCNAFQRVNHGSSDIGVVCPIAVEARAMRQNQVCLMYQTVRVRHTRTLTVTLIKRSVKNYNLGIH